MLRENETARGDLQVVECLNLRLRDGASDVLEPVGAARQVADSAWNPLFRDGSRLLVVESGGLRIGWTDLDVYSRPSGDPMVTVIGHLPASAGAVFADGDTVTVMTGNGPWLLRRGGEGEAPYTAVGLPPQWPDIAVTADEGTLMQRIIEAGDVATLEDGYVDAYRLLAEDLNAVREYMQPVIVRCQLLDSAGHVLHVTPPVCVMPTSGAQLATTLHVPVSDGQHNGCVVEVCGFRLRVTVGGTLPAAWGRRVASLRIMATGQLHCCDMEGKARVTVSRRSGATSATVTANAILPGLTRGANEANVGAAVALFDRLSRQVAVIDRPFDAGAPGTWVVGALAVADVAASAKQFWTALNSHDYGGRPAVSQVSAPHTFSAGMTAENGGRRIFGDVTRFAWRGYGAASFVAADKALAVADSVGTVRVVMDDGSVVRSTTAMRVETLSVGPLLSYPDARARRLTVTAGGAGISVDLRPDASGTCAYWVAPGCLPVALSADFDAAADAGTDIALSVPLAGQVVVTDDCAVTACGFVAHDIRAMLPARSSSGAWDFGRSRFYIFTAADTRMLTVSPTAMAINLTDSRGVGSALRVCAAGDNVYILSGTSLLRINGTRVRAVPGTFDSDRMGYDPERGELVLANPDDNEATVINPDTGRSYTVSLVLPDGTPAGWLADGSCVLARTDRGLCMLDSRYCAGSDRVRVRWSAFRTAAKPAAGPVRSVTVPVSCSFFDGTVSVDRAWLGRSACLRRFSIKGTLHAPLHVPLAVRPAIDLRLTVDGDVSPDFALSRPQLGL